ncbi:MAG: ABC transporter ATP-binding protein [Acidobacteriota bacterium]
MSSFLEVRGLYKAYPSGRLRLQVLSNLNLRVERGQMLAITGSSGSGKSTFLHLVGGMEKPDAGEILFEDLDICSLNPEELATFRNRRIGFIFQFHHLLSEFTALENVMMPLLLRRTPARKAAQTAKQYLKEVGLEERVDHRPGELSGGEQQRVAIARALVGQPHLLLADEPTGNLDDRTSEGIHQLLMEVHRKNELTSIMVTHDPGLSNLCQRRKRVEGGGLVD